MATTTALGVGRESRFAAQMSGRAAQLISIDGRKIERYQRPLLANYLARDT